MQQLNKLIRRCVCVVCVFCRVPPGLCSPHSVWYRGLVSLLIDDCCRLKDKRNTMIFNDQ